MGKTTNRVRTITVRPTSPMLDKSELFAQLALDKPTIEQDALDSLASKIHGIKSARRDGRIIELHTWKQLSKKQAEALANEFRSELETQLAGDGIPTPSPRPKYTNKRG